MRITSVGAGHSTGDGHPRTAQPPVPAPLATGRALVALSLAPSRPAAPDQAAVLPRPQAAFLAHLIAVSADAPQTRWRRRAETQTAIASYTETTLRPQQMQPCLTCSVSF